MKHVFLSYCHDDADFVHILKDQLNQSGFPTWKDLDLQAGDDWHSEIEDAIRNAIAVVAVMSERAQASQYVNFEWAFALGAGVPVLPLLLRTRPDSLHPRLSALQALDFSNYMQRPWDSLVQSLKTLNQMERPFTVLVPRDAPPFIQQAARNLDSLDASERIAAIEVLSEIKDSFCGRRARRGCAASSAGRARHGCKSLSRIKGPARYSGHPGRVSLRTV